MNSLKIHISYYCLYRHPIAGLKYLAGKREQLKDLMVFESIRLLKDVKRPEVLPYLNELRDRRDLFIEPVHKQGVGYFGNSAETVLGKFIYCWIRLVKPENIVETGVSHGLSSWLILNAIRMNQLGTLYSIDLPDNDVNVDYNLSNYKSETGWLVPDALRPNWKLILGSSRCILPELRKQLKEIDLFFHDSDHSYENMTFEFNFANDFLKEGSVLVSDDVQMNNAFRRFTRRKSVKVYFRKGGFCKI